MNQRHHFDPSGTAQVITNNSAGVVGNNLYDVFGVLRHEQGNSQTPWRWKLLQTSQEATLLDTRQTCNILPRVATKVAAYRACPSYSTAGLLDRFLNHPKRWFVLPCILCVLGYLPGFGVYFSDCGLPKPLNWEWQECITLYWDTFIETCQQSVICRTVTKACSYACGFGFIERAFGKALVMPLPAVPTLH